MSKIVEQQWLDLHPDAYAVRPKRRDNAHPYAPGTGPAGQTCGTCQKCSAVDYHAKRYYKCRVLMKFWAHSYGTDIRKKDPACKSWEPATQKVEVFTTRNRAPRIAY